MKQEVYNQIFQSDSSDESTIKSTDSADTGVKDVIEAMQSLKVDLLRVMEQPTQSNVSKLNEKLDDCNLEPVGRKGMGCLLSGINPREHEHDTLGKIEEMTSQDLLKNLIRGNDTKSLACILNMLLFIGRNGMTLFEQAERRRRCSNMERMCPSFSLDNYETLKADGKVVELEARLATPEEAVEAKRRGCVQGSKLVPLPALHEMETEG